MGSSCSRPDHIRLGHRPTLQMRVFLCSPLLYRLLLHGFVAAHSYYLFTSQDARNIIVKIIIKTFCI